MERTIMENIEFAAWLRATYNLDVDGITKEQLAKFKAEFDRAADAWSMGRPMRSCSTGGAAVWPVGG
jgi:hypothetical protein